MKQVSQVSRAVSRALAVQPSPPPARAFAGLPKSAPPRLQPSTVAAAATACIHHVRGVLLLLQGGVNGAVAGSSSTYVERVLGLPLDTSAAAAAAAAAAVIVVAVHHSPMLSFCCCSQSTRGRRLEDFRAGTGSRQQHGCSRSHFSTAHKAQALAAERRALTYLGFLFRVLSLGV